MLALFLTVFPAASAYGYSWSWDTGVRTPGLQHSSLLMLLCLFCISQHLFLEEHNRPSLCTISPFPDDTGSLCFNPLPTPNQPTQQFS